MFIVLSKVLDLAVAPVTWVLVLLVLSAVLRGRGRWPLFCGAAAFAILLGFSLGPVAGGLATYSESGAPSTYRPEVTYDAAVVLGGVLAPLPSRTTGEAELGATADRLTRTFQLWREGRVKAIVLSGGNLTPSPSETSEAQRLSELLQAWGVPAEVLVVEGRSRNTRENALETSRLIAERGYHSVLLVTSAGHMPRALGCFRALGLEPDALPVDRHAWAAQSEGWLPRAAALSEATDVLRELTGRMVYRVAGYTK